MSCGAQIKAWGSAPSGKELLEVPAFLGSCQILPASKPAVITLTRPGPVVVTPPPQGSVLILLQAFSPHSSHKRPALPATGASEAIWLQTAERSRGQ